MSREEYNQLVSDAIDSLEWAIFALKNGDSKKSLGEIKCACDLVSWIIEDGLYEP